MVKLNVTSVATVPCVGLRIRLKPSTLNEPLPESPFVFPVTVIVKVPTGAYCLTVNFTVPAPPLNKHDEGLLTGVPEIVQAVSKGSKPASVTVIRVPGIADTGAGVTVGAALTFPRKADSAVPNKAMITKSKVTAYRILRKAFNLCTSLKIVD